ncbi:hypothetical protein D3C74_431920 [compost metagenome]
MVIISTGINYTDFDPVPGRYRPYFGCPNLLHSPGYALGIARFAVECGGVKGDGGVFFNRNLIPIAV